MKHDATRTKRQRLRIELGEITAGDYLTWVRDPEPPALERELRSIAITAAPLGSTIDATLEWAGAPPPSRAAAAAAGLPVTADVRSVRATPQPDALPRRRRAQCSGPRLQPCDLPMPG
jgi:hypothetical protein